MAHIFISYSNQDRDFALMLADKLEVFFEVWIDRQELEGGVEWEKAIERALNDCTVFIVLVSPHSNESEWVARETIRAEQLKKLRIPILVTGELPLRLLNLHYVDFQGQFEGGFRDLLEILKRQVDPKNAPSDAVDNLLGRGIRAQLSHQFSDANNFIGQALALEPDLSPSLDDFWKTLSEEKSTNYAQQLEQLIERGERIIVEESLLLPAGTYQGQIKAYKWSLQLDIEDKLLDQIDYVQYELHPTFRSPIRIIRDRQSQFRLTSIGWGGFHVPIEIHFKEGSVVVTGHFLEFTNIR